MLSISIFYLSYLAFYFKILLCHLHMVCFTWVVFEVPSFMTCRYSVYDVFYLLICWSSSFYVTCTWCVLFTIFGKFKLLLHVHLTYLTYHFISKFKLLCHLHVMCSTWYFWEVPAFIYLHLICLIYIFLNCQDFMSPAHDVFYLLFFWKFKLL